MKITLVTHTPQPKKAIAAAFFNMGIGMDTTSLDQISEERANEAMSEIFKSHLDAPLEYANFNFFWQDIPIFLRAQLVRHRVGWGFAERSLRFYDANLRKEAIAKYDWDAMPSLKNKIGEKTFLAGKNLQTMMQEEMDRQMSFYDLLVQEGVDQQDARNVIGVWYPTAMQTVCSYRALRTMLADRLSSQAHPFWQKAAHQIKDLVTEVDPVLGAGLINGCDMDGKCRWGSKFDRDCVDCIKAGRNTAHKHRFDLTTTYGPHTQCYCGELNKLLLPQGHA